MLVALPCCPSDVRELRRLLQWILRLGENREHDCLIVHDAAVPPADLESPQELATKIFRSVTVISNGAPVHGWPDGPNSLFKTAALYAKGVNQPFLWLEPDAIPLKPEWLTFLAADYARLGKKYMGHIYGCNTAGLPKVLMSGVAVYAPVCADSFLFNAGPRAWDVTNAELMVGNGAKSVGIYHLWGEYGNPPTFADKNIPGTRVFCLKQIPEGAVLWHRCKDASLIRLLRKTLFNEFDNSEDLVIVLPFCNEDARRMIQTVGWMAELHPGSKFDCLISYENTTLKHQVDAIRGFASMAFNTVLETSYSKPKPGEAVQTMAWRHAALEMWETCHRPWMWNESDCIPLKPDWIAVLQREYRSRGRPFAGPRVPTMTHFNGTMIYAGNTPELLPRTMAATNCVWDVHAAPEMIPHAVDIGHIIQHVWGRNGGKFHPYIGDAPSFKDEASLREVLPTAVCLHRCKDGTLAARLRERMKRQEAA